LVRHDASQAPPSVATCRDILSSGAWSVARYWTDNAESWFQFAAFDFFGWYDVQLPPPPDSRNTINQRARDAAAAAGVNLGQYDSFIVMAFPGVATIPNPKFGQPNQAAQISVGYDAGADGVGPGHTAILVASADRTFMCHELGHVLGFDHTYGILTSGADWSDDGISQLYPVYGDPYDLMSSATFGGSNPTFTVPPSESRAGFPNALSSGPMLSRALLHYTRPMALESTGNVRHDYAGGTNQLITLYPAGSREAGKAELFVYHPLGEDGQGRGRVYVEYRQPHSLFPGTRWDAGLKATGNDRAHTGVIVHVVKDDPASGRPVVWYAGRITFPTADVDVQVDTPFGPVTVAVSPDFARQDNPIWVPVRISKGVTRPGILLETPPSTDEVVVLSSEKRPIPGWEFLGGFTWERRSRTRTAQYIAITSGLSGSGSTDLSKTVTLRWFVGNNMCMNPSGTIALFPPGGTRSVHVQYTVDDAKGILTLKNDPNEGPYVAGVSVQAYDPGFLYTASAQSTFDAPGIEEGWGEDYNRFMRWLYHITHPIPKWRPGPPPIGDIIDQIEEMHQVLVELERVNPGAARALRPLQSEHVRSQFSVARQEPLEPRGRPVVVTTRQPERPRALASET
jgi:hypothetical protein